MNKLYITDNKLLPLPLLLLLIYLTINNHEGIIYLYNKKINKKIAYNFVHKNIIIIVVH